MKFPIKKSMLALSTCSALTLLPLTACSDDSNDSSAADSGDITITNCDKEVSYDNPQKWFINDSNIIASTLAAGAADRIEYVTQLKQDEDLLRAKYGDVVDTLDVVGDNYPSLEEIVSKQPDMYVAGWNYGMTATNNVNPDTLADHNIESYIITESCKSGDGDKRGIEDPWQAVEDDLKNLGALAGTTETADAVIKDIQQRHQALLDAPQPESPVKAFLFDSGTDSIFTSGSFGAPTAILEAAGAKNVMDTIDDTWVSVSWENLAETQPDVIVFVDYPGQSFEEKVKVLQQNPVSKDLPAVREGRFINLPYAMWCSSPLNIDAAEYVRKGLEKFQLAPSSDISTSMELPASVAGQEYFKG